MNLNNIRNLLADIGESNIKVELLANSEGVRMFLKSEEEHELAINELHLKNVTFAVCANAMRALGIEKDMLFTFVQVVPSGVGELVRKQADGYAYIKP